jgi:hypothetical protein
MGKVLETENTTGTDLGAESAAHAGRTGETGVGLGVGAHIDAHFAVLAATAAGNAHVTLDGNTKASKFLYQAQQRRHRTEIAAPHLSMANY